ncbi:MAG: ABC transporter permease [Dysgonomonas sp.]
MKALIKREFIALVCSPVSIFFSIAFLLALGLMLWIFPGNFNILSAGYASLNPFFTLVSVLLIVLIPALTMRSFSEEKRTGNLDVYRSRPVSLSSLFFSKTLSVWLFFIFILATTAVYIYIIYVLSIPKGNLDINEIVSSYAGVMLLSLVFIIIGVFSSSLSKNQAVAYVLAVILNFLVFYGFDLLASVFDSIKVQSFISSIGISEHYRLMQKGVFQLKDIIVFVNYIIIFTVLGIYILSLKGAKDRKFLLYSAIAVIILNCIMIFIPNVRADFTEDRKYTMSDYSKKTSFGFKQT